MSERTIAERIQQRRLQMLIHSYLYYELDTNIITDEQWSKWARELASLQNTYPEIAEVVYYADLFKDWDGSTGAHLIYNEPTIRKAKYLLEHRNEAPNKMVLKQAGKASSEVSERKTNSKQRSKRLF